MYDSVLLLRIIYEFMIWMRLCVSHAFDTRIHYNCITQYTWLFFIHLLCMFIIYFDQYVIERVHGLSWYLELTLFIAYTSICISLTHTSLLFINMSHWIPYAFTTWSMTDLAMTALDLQNNSPCLWFVYKSVSMTYISTSHWHKHHCVSIFLWPVSLSVMHDWFLR